MHFSPKLIFRYLRECYELDTKTINVTNFFAKKVENRIWVEGTDEVLNGSLPYLPLLDEQAEKIEENLSFYSKEKSLYAFAHFFVGRVNGRRLCAPLIFIPAEIIRKDEFPYIRLNQNQKFLNYNFLNTIKKEGTPPFDELFDFLLKSPIIDFNISAKIATVLEENFDDVEADGIRYFPELISEKKIKLRRPKDHLEVHAAMGIGLVKSSSKTLGIISELNDLADSDDYSGALNSILTNTSKLEDKPEVDSRVPSILSEGQGKVLENALRYSKSIVIGPPGTGKSFTIANVAIDHVLREKSVLIVSKTDEAVDVVLEKLTELGLGTAAMRPGKKGYAREIRKRIKLLLMKSYRQGLEKRTKEVNYESYYNKLELIKLEEQFNEALDKELKWGNLLFENRNKTSVLSKLKKRYIKWKTKYAIPNWIISEQYYTKKKFLLKNHQKLALFGYEEQLNRFLKTNRSDLVGFLKAINAYSLSKQEALFEELDFSQLLRTFPIWLCKLSDLYEALPLQKDLFDLVIIDEASQVDLASIMPALQRAKKVMVVGDPNQLRHFSFVARGQQDSLKRKIGLDGIRSDLLNYRDSSILDICFEQSKSSDEVVFLDEHFRGNEELLAFSNKNFYGGQLKVMKSLPVHQYQSLWIENCDGIRTDKGINELEIDRLIKHIKEIQAMNKVTGSITSIGVLSPFRNQSERIIERIREEIGVAVVKKHRIMVGTPYSFQGNERDVMIISWCVDEQTHPSALRYLNNPQIFNVAVTRAKRKVINLISFDPKFLKADMLLKEYLYKNIEQNTEVNEAQEIHDQFIKEVSGWLMELGCEFICDYEVASIPVDILVTSNKKSKAIDLIGFPGKFVDSIDLNQYMVLQRAGVSVFPLPYSHWHLYQEFAKKEFIEFLNTEQLAT
ncbi:MAG: ATP-binding protein [Crocinitomicaceae bacterium]|nr:ATP-binding protein [Flavobacteriales bacterium]NQZ37448.1 ATP-binding protein [Crocinitomicaceae bacterium]